MGELGLLSGYLLGMLSLIDPSLSRRNTVKSGIRLRENYPISPHFEWFFRGEFFRVMLVRTLRDNRILHTVLYWVQWT